MLPAMSWGDFVRLAMAACLPLAIACGDDGGGTTGPEPLVPDPAVLTACTAATPAAGQSRAKFISCTDELPPGRLVSGRVGDIVLENSKLKVVIRGFGEGYYLMGTKAGGIVDAARVGGEDLIKEIIPIIELNGGAFDEFVIVEAGDDGPATVVVRGPVEPVPFVQAAIATSPVPAIVEQHYILEPDADEVLIRTYLFKDDSGASDRAVTVGDAFFYGGKVKSWIPGTGLIEGTAQVQLIASTGTNSSYGFAYPAEDLAAIQFIDIANVKLGLGPTRTVGAAEPINRYFIVGDGSTSSVTDRAYALRGTATGTLKGTTGPGLNVSVEKDGDPITIARADSSGNYSLQLPAGSYDVWSQSPGNTDGTKQSASISVNTETTLNLDAGGSGNLLVTVVDDSAAAMPARVVITNATTGERIKYAGADGVLSLALPPADYTVVVSRGVEYDAFTADPVTITDGQTTSLPVTLNHLLDTSGWIAVDTHLHSEMSTDSQVTLEDRLHSVAAEGVEVAISTDHDFVTDYAPVIAELGLASFLTSQVGIETSSLIWGHVNAWPLTPDYDKPAGDGIPWFERSPQDVFANMRSRDVGVIQINHPRSSSSGMLKIIDFDPDTLTARLDPEDLGLPPGTDLSDLDVDALEIANDFQADDFALGFPDWINMVAAGHPAAATGSSDSHGAGAYPGNSRTYVYVGPGNDDPATVDLDAINAAIRDRKVTVSQGAFVTASIVNPANDTPAAPGDLVDLSSPGTTELQIKVQAPPWMPLSKIVIYGGTQIIDEITLDSGDTATVRFDARHVVATDTSDSFYIVMALPAGRGDPVLGQPDASFTNPLMYDADGDGAWTP